MSDYGFCSHFFLHLFFKILETTSSIAVIFRSLPIRGNPYISLEIHSYIASYIFLLRPIMIIAL